jgi:hypothetical protein
VEICGEQSEGAEKRGLQAERGGHHVCADEARRGGSTGIGHAPGAVADEGFAHGVEADEGCCDAAGVERGEVGDVVEDAGEDYWTTFNRLELDETIEGDER